MTTQLLKSFFSKFTDAELNKIALDNFGYINSDICEIIGRIDSAIYFGELDCETVLNEYEKLQL
jgi:hypothetical protein